MNHVRGGRSECCGRTPGCRGCCPALTLGERDDHSVESERYEVFSLSVIGTYQCDPGPCVNLRAVVASRALKIELMGGKLRLSIPPDYTFVLISTRIRRGLVHISKHIDLRETDPSSQPIRNIRRPLKWNSTRRCQHNENVVR